MMSKALQNGMQQGMFSAYNDLIKSGMLSMKDAASELGMSEADLSHPFPCSNLLPRRDTTDPAYTRLRGTKKARRQARKIRCRADPFMGWGP